ncbi:hypothetical protein ABBQ32_14179 [Trebouxia sp. C0010 RCD-2024]
MQPSTVVIKLQSESFGLGGQAINYKDSTVVFSKASCAWLQVLKRCMQPSKAVLKYLRCFAVSILHLYEAHHLSAQTWLLCTRFQLACAFTAASCHKTAFMHSTYLQ